MAKVLIKKLDTSVELPAYKTNWGIRHGFNGFYK